LDKGYHLSSEGSITTSKGSKGRPFQKHFAVDTLEGFATFTPIAAFASDNCTVVAARESCWHKPTAVAVASTFAIVACLGHSADIASYSVAATHNMIVATEGQRWPSQFSFCIPSRSP